MTIPKTLTVTQLVAKTGFTRTYIYALVRHGAWAAIKVGGAQTATIRVIESSVEAWFEAQLQGHRLPAPRALDADRELPPVDNPAFS